MAFDDYLVKPVTGGEDFETIEAQFALADADPVVAELAAVTAKLAFLVADATGRNSTTATTTSGSSTAPRRSASRSRTTPTGWSTSAEPPLEENAEIPSDRASTMDRQKLLALLLVGLMILSSVGYAVASL
jgi:hypothetical protein